MMKTIILITLALLITAVLLYSKRKCKPELLVLLLGIFSILTLFSTFYCFTSHAEVWILIPVYAVILILIFFGIGKVEPLKTWRNIFIEYRRYILGPEFESKRGLESIRFMHKKRFLRLKEDYPIYLLAGFITVALLFLWLLLEWILKD